MSNISVADLYRKLQILGVSVPSNPAGAMTGAQIIDAINTTLGYSYWQQGTQGSVFVNDFGQDSADLASYVGIDGKWHFPDGTVIVVNTPALSPSSVIGRNIVPDGSLFIVPTSGGGSKGITLNSGSGVGTCMLEQSTGTMTIGDLFLAGLDSDRPLFSGTGGDELILNTTLWGALNPGTVNCTTIKLTSIQQLLFQQPMVIGSACSNLDLNVTSTIGGFLGSNTGFDLRATPDSVPRSVNINQITTRATPGQAFVLIQSDNGENRVTFNDCEWDNSGGGWLVQAASDATFNANPLFSPNFFFDVTGYGRTQRIGEQYFNGATVIPITTIDTFTDLFAAAIADGGLSNGIVPTANPGEFEYILPDPSIVIVNYNIQGTPTTGTQNYTVAALYQPYGGSYGVVAKGGFNIEDTVDPATTALSMHFNLAYSLKMSQGDKFKAMVKNLGGTQDFTLNDFACLAELV